jgi:hypothetical protein
LGWEREVVGNERKGGGRGDLYWCVGLSDLKRFKKKIVLFLFLVEIEG